MDKPFVKREMRQYELLRIIFQLHAAGGNPRDSDRHSGRAWISGAAQDAKTAPTAEAGIVH